MVDHRGEKETGSHPGLVSAEGGVDGGLPIVSSCKNHTRYLLEISSDSLGTFFFLSFFFFYLDCFTLRHL